MIANSSANKLVYRFFRTCAFYTLVVGTAAIKMRQKLRQTFNGTGGI